MKEGIGNFDPPTIKGDPAEYTTGFFGPEDMVLINKQEPECDLKGLLNSLNTGKKCFGVKYKEEIAAFCWISFTAITYKTVSSPLKENDVYFTDMYTMKQFRGKNIAAHLRYKCMILLMKMGKDTFYSVTECFNTPAIRYKKKLNAKKQRLCLYLKLFNKYKWHFTLRTY